MHFALDRMKCRKDFGEENRNVAVGPPSA